MAWLLIGFIFLFVITSLPNIWTRAILKKYSKPHPTLPGTGLQFAEHLIKKYQLEVSLEQTPQGDHYDPIGRVVRISNGNAHSNSLTAITTVAHEIGHALQHQQNYQPLLQRTLLVERAQRMQQFSGIALMLTPVLIPLLHTPIIGLVTFAAGFIGMGIPVILHLSTLPVEWDASYNRALPLLKEGQYLSPTDLKRARKILRACALTYVAASLSSLFNLWKWLRAIKGR